MTFTIAEHLVESYSRLTDADRTRLVGQGVPPHALDSYPGPLSAGDNGMFTLPIMADGAYSDFIGIAAWSQRDPSRFSILDGADDDVLGLGMHLLEFAVYRRASLAVTGSPLEWLRHWGASFCPIRWPDSAFELMHLNRIIALPADFGPELRRRLEDARPRMPRIEVPV